jgi:hypothetical protein
MNGSINRRAEPLAAIAIEQEVYRSSIGGPNFVAFGVH